ncbi:MAG: hypothetical protein IAE93_01345 [Ignavibacteria bacterium]|nr:hypothetical protein [Ignavibacteria bacterium]
MKKLIFSAILIFVSSCPLLSGSITNISSAENDSAVIALTGDVLAVIKERDFDKLTGYIHPIEGIRFSPYAYIDTSKDAAGSPSGFRLNAYSDQKRIWGSYDGTGDPIDMTVKEYFNRFVYDVDFLNAEKTTFNSKSSHGTDLDNLADIYPGCVYTESYFSGFDEKFGGMDWRALRLVYKEYEGKFYLVGIIHDEWTI